MLIAISQRGERESRYGSIDVLERSYPEYFDRFGLNLIPIPNYPRTVEKYFSDLKIEGVILSGGGDVQPSLYGGNPDYPGNYSPERDETEKSLLEIAIDRDLPVLGICRGMQFLNAYFGGQLIQNIKGEIPNAMDHIATQHPIILSEGFIAAQLGTNRIDVNSYHNQGFTEDQLSSELTPFAFAEDHTIEGLYHPKYAIAAIMWHPERFKQPSPLNDLLTKAFASRQFFWRVRK